MSTIVFTTKSNDLKDPLPPGDYVVSVVQVDGPFDSKRSQYVYYRAVLQPEARIEGGVGYRPFDASAYRPISHILSTHPNAHGMVSAFLMACGFTFEEGAVVDLEELSHHLVGRFLGVRVANRTREWVSVDPETGDEEERSGVFAEVTKVFAVDYGERADVLPDDDDAYTAAEADVDDMLF